MKCLVINLDRSTDRLAHVTSEFARLGVPFERVPALDANAGCPIHVPSLTSAEVCCFLSHRACWQIIADGADRYGAVFEDDVVFSRNAGPLLSQDNWVLRDADVIKLETFFTKVRVARRSVAIGHGYSLTRLVGEHVGAAGYLVSKTAAQKLLQRTRNPKTFIDHVLFSPNLPTCSLNTTYQLTPALCAQNQFFSNKPALPTLIQDDAPHRKRNLAYKIVGEASRAFAHCRNGSLWGTEKITIALHR